MNGLDIIALVFIAFFFYQGFRKGAINELFTLLAFIIGIVVSLKITHVVIEKVAPDVQSPLFPFIMYLIVFLLALIAVQFLGKLLSKLIKTTLLSLPNKLAGGTMGILKALLVLGTIFWLLQKTQLVDIENQNNSLVFNFLAEQTPKFLALISDILPIVKEQIQDIEQYFDSLLKPKVGI
ncbi:MAG: CvpA family protein [Bacteroidetes bacterium]|nr:CvpA family protein [Bacteroidota bacterium]